MFVNPSRGEAMRRTYGLTLAVLVCVIAAACSAGTGGRSAGGESLSLITSAEIEATGHADAHSLVQALRPQWLRVRGASSISGTETLKVYLDGSLLGGPDHLRRISTQSIGSIRYLDGIDATQRWGLDHGSGAIVVSSRGRSD
jgi:hypothetical protein